MWRSLPSTMTTNSKHLNHIPIQALLLSESQDTSHTRSLTACCVFEAMTYTLELHVTVDVS